MSLDGLEAKSEDAMVRAALTTDCRMVGRRELVTVYRVTRKETCTAMPRNEKMMWCESVKYAL